MTHPQGKVRRLFELIEPIATVSFSEDVDRAFREVGMRNFWDGYFAGRAAPLGLAPAEVVHAAFYNFADGEVARHIPWVWTRISPEEAISLRERASAAALRRKLGDIAEDAGLQRIADLATRAAVSAPTEGRALYAGLRALAVPEDPVARLWHATTLLREHRGDGHIAALLAHGIGGIEGHALLAASFGLTLETFGRTHHLPGAELATVAAGLRSRGLLDGDGALTDAGRTTKQRIEDLTDTLATAPYLALDAEELDELIAGLGPVFAAAYEHIPLDS
ncbi:MarR family transcriptional regulator [Nocardioides sp. QY071]|uniref:SCO6745 family protein n=1 Tax=Nocardioides sp. QY071 TaxID=3044187 RepID=UPI00249A0BAD|nr:MarR family transcriptional regulator [Nocardioides sp. QY071]WGY00952.1 MarR family transcriptional regulator [Nocardioides sp. QY071]